MRLARIRVCKIVCFGMLIGLHPGVFGKHNSSVDLASWKDLKILTQDQIHISQSVDSIGNKFVTIQGEIPKSCVAEDSYSSVSKLDKKILTIRVSESCLGLKENSAELARIMSEPKVDLQSIVVKLDQVKSNEMLYLNDQGQVVPILLKNIASQFCNDCSASQRTAPDSFIKPLNLEMSSQLNTKTETNSKVFVDESATVAKPKLPVSPMDKIEARIYSVIQQIVEQDPKDSSGLKTAFVSSVRKKMAEESQPWVNDLYDKSGKMLNDVLTGLNPFSEMAASAAYTNNYNESSDSSSFLAQIFSEIRMVYPATKNIINQIDLSYRNPISTFQNGVVSASPYHTLDAKTQIGIVRPAVSVTKCIDRTSASIGGQSQSCEYDTSIEYSAEVPIGARSTLGVSYNKKNNQTPAAKDRNKTDQEFRASFKYSQPI